MLCWLDLGVEVRGVLMFVSLFRVDPDLVTETEFEPKFKIGLGPVLESA